MTESFENSSIISDDYDGLIVLIFVGRCPPFTAHHQSPPSSDATPVAAGCALFSFPIRRLPNPDQTSIPPDAGRAFFERRQH
ncbi:hypothetical protein [Agrobacterium sp. GD03642]|uniref:hypothetical protein n=1 Tax=Agrobacterium sp. GD03642 TaxID=2975356 RepID=UPI00244A338C|nr:hypothetical protein [Agrobacterium sp. GD03642]MDH2223005.1 hypothetical protein [Agrobacterium sp. GD03642]